MNKIYRVINVVFILGLLSCTDVDEKIIFHLEGSIDKTLVTELKQQNSMNSEISVSSSGGLPSQAMIAAHNIIANKNILVVEGNCFSACAEYLLPVAERLEFRNEPLVGFHWNAMMIEYLMREQATRDMDHCIFSSVKELNGLQREAGVNNKFWKEVLLRLGQVNFTVYYRSGKCPQKDMKFENRMWLPTSEQLRRVYKLKFEGSVCADNFEKCKSKVDRKWPKNARIVVGDVVYISKGHDRSGLTACDFAQEVIDAYTGSDPHKFRDKLSGEEKNNLEIYLVEARKTRDKLCLKQTREEFK